MWTGKVARTERHGVELFIIVSYSNGTNSFDETITTDKTQSDTWLSDQITNRLNQLNALDVYEASINQDPIIDVSVSLDQSGILTPVGINPVDLGKDVIVNG